MKKIIAMLLCVAMVAALGASAFAAGPWTVVPKQSTMEEYYAKAVADAKKAAGTPEYLTGALETYAKELKDAKKALSNAKKELADLQADAVKAIQVAQNYAVATAYEVAMAEFEADVTKAIGEYYYEVALELVGGDPADVADVIPSYFVFD